MTLYAVFSDIHANYPALIAAARDARAVARREGVERVEFISLGDVVDYGPQPNECVAWVRRYAAVTVQGNHDRAVAAPLTSPPLEIELNLWPIVLWTRAELRNRHKQALHRWRYERGMSALLSAFTPFHSDIDESDAYINNTRTADRTLQRLITPYGLFGHTHLQGYYIHTGAGVRAAFAWPSELWSASAQASPAFVPTNEWLPLPGEGYRVILNPGSVGQPRQNRRLGSVLIPHDYRAAYLLLRQRADQRWEARFQRISYPVEETVRRMRERIRSGIFQSKIDALHSRGVDIFASTDHPFTSRLSETMASMETLLPALLEQLIKQLAPPEAAL
jgi:predicted phosphodiesterase